MPKRPAVALAVALAAALTAGGAACTSLETVRLRPDTVEVGPGLRAVAGLQATATSFYVAAVPIPGVDLDKVVNEMLVAAAKTMGADKITALTFDIDPGGGLWFWRRLLGWRTAHARGIAVEVVAPPPDPRADEGPEPDPLPCADHGPATPTGQ